MDTADSVLISGAGIAGPALAYWLGRHGYEPTVVERAEHVRPGGQAVDFRGDTHRTVLSRMGVWDELLRHDTGGSPMSFVDETGEQLAFLPGEFAGGEVEIMRDVLSRVLHERSAATTRYRFGDSIARLTQRADGVEVEFDSGRRQRFGLVVGADGVHSNVRRLAFGPESRYIKQFNYYVATWSLHNDFKAGITAQLYNTPGKAIVVAADPTDTATAHVTVYFASPPLEYDRHDPEQQKSIVSRQFAETGWHAPRLLAGLRDAADLYFDGIVRADVPKWSTGRVALLGDAAYGATIGGMGAGTSVVGAYVLAGELAAANGDHERAYPAYERALADIVRGSRAFALGAAKALVPSSRLGVWALVTGGRLVSALPSGVTRALAKLNAKGMR
ncbi:MAG: FAD-dependent monooxygenase, partial [Stackebrandtia sp.]